MPRNIDQPTSPEYAPDYGSRLPDPVVETATVSSGKHQERNEDKVLGLPDRELPELVEHENPEEDRNRLKEAVEKEARYSDTLEQLKVYGVLDGVSTGSGALASRIASAEIAATMASLADTDTERDLPPEKQLKLTEQKVKEALDTAQKAIMDYKNDPSRADRKDMKGMATTADILRVVGDKAVYGHIGDSAIYRLRDGELEKMTQDHSGMGHFRREYGVSEREYEQMREAEEVGEDWTEGMKNLYQNYCQNDALRKKLENGVYASLGADTGPMEVGNFDLAPGDKLLLCSDGISDNWKMDDLQEALKQGITAEQLTEQTLKDMDKPDDVSFAMIEFPSEEAAELTIESETASEAKHVESMRQKVKASGDDLVRIKEDLESGDPERLAVYGGRQEAVTKWQRAAKEYLENRRMYLEEASQVNVSEYRELLEQKSEEATVDSYVWSEVARLADIDADPGQASGQVSEQAEEKYASLVKQGMKKEKIADLATEKSTQAQGRSQELTEQIMSFDPESAKQDLERVNQQLENFETESERVEQSLIDELLKGIYESDDDETGSAIK